MDCCLCGSLNHIYRPPRNTICMSCFEGALSILNLGQRLDSRNVQENAESGEENGKSVHNRGQQESAKPVVHEQKGLAHAFEKMKQLKHAAKAATKRIEFLESLAVAFRTGMHSDIELITDDGLSLQAHRVVMAAKSSVFRAMFEADSFKVADSGSIRIPDLTHQELKCLLEFMYTGNLPAEGQKEYTHALLLAADKYNIPLLIDVCESYMAATLNSSNALRVLELATICSATSLMKMAVSAVLRNYEDIIFSQAYEEFAVKNPMLSVLLTKALVQDLKRQ
eukprot:c53947_g1_i1 orf=130-972(+)